MNVTKQFIRASIAMPTLSTVLNPVGTSPEVYGAMGRPNQRKRRLQRRRQGRHPSR